MVMMNDQLRMIREWAMPNDHLDSGERLDLELELGEGAFVGPWPFPATD